MAGDKPFFITQNAGFLEADASVDLLHTDRTKAVGEDSATETQYFGFSVPEEGIHSLDYLWHRPNLGIITGGVWTWRGIKASAPWSEMCDIHTFMNDSALAGDLHEYRLANGYGVKMLEPMKRFHMTYRDPVRDNAIDVLFEGMSPVVLWADGNHIEQAMRATGTLVLRGKRYKVDSTTVRDRSWGKSRPETIMTLPPPSWMTGVFGPDFSFNCNCFDQVEGNPELEPPFAMPREKTLNGGWLWRDGKLGRIIDAKKSVARTPGALLPAGVEVECRDEHGRGFHLRGRLVASCPWETWANVSMSISLMRWECEGRVAYGDCQEALWGDYLNFMADRERGARRGIASG